MIAYKCKYCGKFTIRGYVNEYDEHFCTTGCYTLYCLNCRYGVNLDKLKPVEQKE